MSDPATNLASMTTLDSASGAGVRTCARRGPASCAFVSADVISGQEAAAYEQALEAAPDERSMQLFLEAVPRLLVQHQADASEKTEEGGSDFADRVCLKGEDRNGEVAQGSASAELVDLCRGRVHLGLRGGEHRSIAETSDDMKECGTISSPGANRDGLEDFDIGRDAGIVGKDEAEVRGQHPDHRGSMAAVTDGAADDRGVEAKAAAPDAVGENDGAGRVLKVVFGTEEAPQRGPRTEQWQEVGGHVGDFDLLGGAIAGEGTIGNPDAGDLIELRGSLAEVVDLKRGKRRSARVAKA